MYSVLERVSEKLERVIVGGLIALMIFSTLAHGAVEPWSVLIFESLLLVLLLVWALKLATAGQATVRVPVLALPLAALLVLALLQGVTRTDEEGWRWSAALDVEATRFATLTIFCLCLGFLLAANVLVGRERMLSFARLVTLYGLGLAIFGLMQHFTWNGKFYWLREPSTPVTSPFGPFVNRNHFAGYIEMLLPVPVALMTMRGVRREVRLIYFFAAVVMGIAVIVSLSRGGMISLAVSLSFVLVVSLCAASARRQKQMSELGAPQRIWLSVPITQFAAVIVISLTIVAGVFWVGADPVLKRFSEGSVANSATVSEAFYKDRGFIWRDTLAMIRANLTMGVGIGSFATAYPMYTQGDGSVIVMQAHNEYLQALADGGISGGLIALSFLLLLVRDIKRSLGHPDSTQATLALGFSGGIVALLTHSLFDFNLQLPANALLFLMLCAIVSHISERTAQARAKAKAHKQRDPYEVEMAAASSPRF